MLWGKQSENKDEAANKIVQELFIINLEIKSNLRLLKEEDIVGKGEGGMIWENGI